MSKEKNMLYSIEQNILNPQTEHTETMSNDTTYW